MGSGLRRGAAVAAGAALAAVITAGATLAQPAAAPAPAAPAPATKSASGAAGPFGVGGGPIDISADQLEVVDAEHRAVWRGNVEALQNMNRLRTPVLNVFFQGKAAGAPAPAAGAGPGASWGQIERMEADGPVYYVTPQQNARGDHATYEAATNTITMTGNVVLVQDKNVVQGEKLVIDTKTNHSTLVSTPQARGGPQRVRGVFYPNQNNQAGAQAPASGAAPKS